MASAAMKLVQKGMERHTGIMAKAVALHHWAEAFTEGHLNLTRCKFAADLGIGHDHRRVN